ncbi:pirin family protein [Saccharicrinis sp. FJH62]|uniref:pirin family protein n=1 Tax=Saccharicrinis sp. FJH62 TaxID=3344657 RepID=UPI0035D4CB08
MSNVIKSIKPLGFNWETRDPFLFCVHHNDHYPHGNEHMGPDASLAGRNIGNDFTVKDGWRMYHGEKVPGFPAHPHRGFETITIVLKGFIDHSDSANAACRYGNGDVQWMTAGSGLQHAEMFPLLNRNEDNPLELFQIWLNLPRKSKLCDPYYTMFWAEDIPKVNLKNSKNKQIEINVIAGKINETDALKPSPDSWAADPENDVAVWLIKLDPEAEWQIPETSPSVNRDLFFYKGSTLKIDGEDIKAYHSVSLKADEEIQVLNGSETAYLVLLQGKPINEPVAQYGPFVMNYEAEIRQAYSEYRQTQFGGWPWGSYEMVHPRDKGRFAIYADGREEVK